MPFERRPPDDPQEWMNRARSNLAKARHRGEDIYLEDLCFDAQQAAEKAIKAVLLHTGAEFPLIHDLGLLPKTIAQPAHQTTRLTRFAVAARYSGLQESVTEERYTELLTIAAGVVDWATATLATESS